MIINLISELNYISGFTVQELVSLIANRSRLFTISYNAMLINYHIFPFVLGICSILMYYFFGFYTLDFDKANRRDSMSSAEDEDEDNSRRESILTEQTRFSVSLVSNRNTILSRFIDSTNAIKVGGSTKLIKDNESFGLPIDGI